MSDIMNRTSERRIFSDIFLKDIYEARQRAQDVLVGCLEDRYAVELRRFCEETGYQLVNAISPIMFAFSFLNSRSVIKMRFEGKEEESRSGSMSLFVVGPTASGKTTILSKPLLDLMRWEKSWRADSKDKIRDFARRVEYLEKKSVEVGLSVEEGLELKSKREYLSKEQPVFLSYTTPEKLLNILGEQGLAAIIEDEGESLVKNIFERQAKNGLHMGSMLNKLLDGTPISYDTKSNPAGVDLGEYAFSIYCNVQEEFLREMERWGGDITNKIGRFDLIFITDAESKSVAHMSNFVGAEISMPLIRDLLQDTYQKRIKERDFRSGNVTIDGEYFMRVYRANHSFWADIEKRGTVSGRIYELFRKHRKRWADYARGLAPLCKDTDSLSRAVGAYLVLMICNISEYYVLDGISKNVTGDMRDGLKEFLIENGIFDEIKYALDSKIRGYNNGHIKISSLRDSFRRHTGVTSSKMFYKLLEKLKQKGIVQQVDRGEVEVLDFISPPEFYFEKVFDFGASCL